MRRMLREGTSMTDEQLGDEWDGIHEARIDRELEDKNMEEGNE